MLEGEMQIPDEVALEQTWKRITMFFTDVQSTLKNKPQGGMIAKNQVRVWLKNGGFDFLRNYVSPQRTPERKTKATKFRLTHDIEYDFPDAKEIPTDQQSTVTFDDVKVWIEKTDNKIRKRDRHGPPATT